MRYHQKNKQGKKKIAFIAFFLAVVILSLSFSWPNFLPEKLYFVAGPIWKLRDFFSQSLEDRTDILESKKDLIAQKNELESKLEKAESKLITTDLLKKENQELKNILERTAGSKVVLARVISKSGLSLYSTLIIDLGQNRVFKGQEVFADDVLLGLVDEVYKEKAKIKLLSAPGNKYEVEVGPEAVSASALGLGGGNFEISLPRGVDVKVGDEIISPALSIKLLGRIEHIESEPANSFQKILFKSPVNLNKVKWVTINL